MSLQNLAFATVSPNGERNIQKHHISFEERLKIEALLKAKVPRKQIIAVIGCSRRTLEREIERGMVRGLLHSDLSTYDEYSAHKAQQVHEDNGKRKGSKGKIGQNPDLKAYIELVVKKAEFSPYAALQAAKNGQEVIDRNGRVVATAEQSQKITVDICVKTVYNGVDRGALAISRKDLLREGWRQDKSKPQRGTHTKGKLITERPAEVNNRERLGDWEGDLVVSCKGGSGALLTLTDRKSREEKIVKLRDKTQQSVLAALEKLRKSGVQFRTITFDNGSEFLNFEAIQKAVNADVYYSHAYSSFERGTNENANGMIRRKFPKGTDFSKISATKIQYVQDWMNNYPRAILGGLSANLYHTQCVI